MNEIHFGFMHIFWKSFRFCVNQLTDSSVEVLATELVKHKIVKVLG